MVTIVYLTTNKVNNHIYIGVHDTKNPNIFDGYLGDGIYINSPKTYMHGLTAFLCAVRKYGPNAFYRTILKCFKNRQDALDLEACLVSRDFIERTDTYNITLGGGDPPKLNKNIYLYSLNGIFIKKWESIKSITDYFQVNKDRVRMVINDKRSFNNSYWSEIEYNILDTHDYRPSSRGFIRLYTTQGLLLKTFKNTTEASKQLDIDRQTITNAIYGKYATSGYWFLKEGETIESYLDGSIKQEPPIYMYSESGIYLRSFKNISEIKKEFKYNKCDLKRAIKNHKLFNSYYWSEEKYENILIENPEIQITIPKKVYLYTLENDFVKEWDSINECKKEFPSVLQVLLNKRLHCKKFKFTFNKLS